jgi:bacterioferritin
VHNWPRSGAPHPRAESFDETRHAETITDRILLLDGLPNYQRLFSLHVGQTIREKFEADLAIEITVVERFAAGHPHVPRHGRPTSADLFEIILRRELHIDYLQTQLELMDKLGEELYLAQCAGPPRRSPSGRGQTTASPHELAP